MKLLALLLSLAAAPAVFGSGFDTGLDAYNRGDFAGALRAWLPMAEKGDANVQFNVGLVYARGRDPLKDERKAVEWYRRAADQGVAAAQYNLGVVYANGGGGIIPNPREAADWFLKAARQGIIDAEFYLGQIYSESGSEIRNYAEAERWYRLAASHGVARAAFRLGLLYDLGSGVPQDYAAAEKWYRQAAEAGYAPALTNLGILYYNGQGPRRDAVEAYTWLARAQKLGDGRASDLIAWIGPNLKEEQIRRAQARVAEWTPSAIASQSEDADPNLFLPRPPEHAADPSERSRSTEGSWPSVGSFTAAPALCAACALGGNR